MAWLMSPVVTYDFSIAQAWNDPSKYSRGLTDIDFDGDADLYGFGSQGLVLGWGGQMRGPLSSQGPGFLTRAESFDRVTNLGADDGYDNSYVRKVVDVGNFGDIGKEIIGQGNAGIFWYANVSELFVPATATSPNVTGYYLQNFDGPRLIQDFGRDQGWNSSHELTFQFLSTADAYGSVVGFGNFGVVVARQAFQNIATSGTYTINISVGNSAGWDGHRDERLVEDHFGKRLDLNADGITDFVGFGPNGAVFSYGALDGLGRWTLTNPQTATFGGTGANFGAAQGWDQSSSPRYLVDMNRDNKVDVVAFGYDGVYVALGQGGNGQPFGAPTKVFSNLGIAQGWGGNENYIREFGDFNGDGFMDIVAFGQNKTYIAMNTTGTNGAPVTFISQATFEDSNHAFADLAVAQGWNSTDHFRAVADVNGDGRADIVAAGAFNTVVWSYDGLI